MKGVILKNWFPHTTYLIISVGQGSGTSVAIEWLCRTLESDAQLQWTEPVLHDLRASTCSHSLLFDVSRPVAMHWNVAFCPALTSTSPRRRKCGDLSAENEIKQTETYFSSRFCISKSFWLKNTILFSDTNKKVSCISVTSAARFIPWARTQFSYLFLCRMHKGWRPVSNHAS